MIGASLANPEKLYFGVLGDLAFFYDMNVLGNHHVGRNVRIMLINNGRGTEFRNYNHPAQAFKNDADAYMAAAGHYGNKSPVLVRHYAEDLGYEYLSANTKEEFLENAKRFVTEELTEKPILFELFTNSEEESKALQMLRGIEVDAKSSAKKILKDIIGTENTAKLKTLLHK